MMLHFTLIIRIKIIKNKQPGPIGNSGKLYLISAIFPQFTGYHPICSNDKTYIYPEKTELPL